MQHLDGTNHYPQHGERLRRHIMKTRAEVLDHRLNKLESAYWRNQDRIDDLWREYEPNEHNLEMCYIRSERLSNLIDRTYNTIRNESALDAEWWDTMIGDDCPF
jgi:hypothetical protein